MRIYIPETSVTRAVCVEINSGFVYVAASYSHDGASWKNDAVVFIGFDWRPGRKWFFHYINI